MTQSTLSEKRQKAANEAARLAFQARVAEAVRLALEAQAKAEARRQEVREREAAYWKAMEEDGG